MTHKTNILIFFFYPCQSLLRMLEGTIINVTDKSGNNPHNNRRGGMPGSPIGNGQAGNGNTTTGNGGNPGGKGETYAVDTSNILFILSGAFVGLDKTIQDRMAKGVRYHYLDAYKLILTPLFLYLVNWV